MAVLKDRKKAMVKAFFSSFRRRFDSFLSTSDARMDEVANYFSERYSGGFVEGQNDKIKTIERRYYGIFNIDHIFRRIRIDLEGYTLFA